MTAVAVAAPKIQSNKPMPVSRQAVAHKEFDLLVRTGLGVEPIAPALARLLRELIGAEGCFIGWFDEMGTPAGFFHDSAPVSAREVFIRNPALFRGPDEFTMLSMARRRGLAVGGLLHPSRAFFKSNTFNLLMKPCQHHHGLDLRIEVNAAIRMAVGLFRNEAQPFFENDVYRLSALVPALKQALMKSIGTANLVGHDHALMSTNVTPSEITDLSDTGLMLLSSDCERISMIDEQATVLCRLAGVFDYGASLIKPMTTPPQFVRQLCRQLLSGEASNTCIQLAVVGGVLVVTATWLNSVASCNVQSTLGEGEPPTNNSILVTISYQKPAAIDVVRHISQLSLSPLQSRIAMFAAVGGSRMECAAHHQVSKEALKKHLREIYAAVRCADWHELHHKLSLG